eukprot:TRINITY_DN8995_c0_g1_i3.p1 TRINITY_DN8995_c0_g1~~TRINITY_DN8995_c0_g1_i3.p1  ORF type:complete len:210 (+),score=61.67 TRINITY_DN8995_c0_g1_i3:103-732(+)
MNIDDHTKNFKVLKTVLEMMADRGYITPPHFQDLTLKKFEETYTGTRDSLMMVCSRKDNEDDKVYINFSDKDKIPKDEIYQHYKTLTDRNFKNMILITKPGAISTSLKQTIQELNIDTKLRLEPFEDTELLVNITKHELVPKHVVITDDEKRALLDRYRLKESQLPRILASDPVARYYGLQKKQVVKIIRTSETAGKYVTYRIVFQDRE